MGDEAIERAIGSVAHAIEIAGEKRDAKAGRGRRGASFGKLPIGEIVGKAAGRHGSKSVLLE